MSKMTSCKACGAEIAASAKSCPKCGAKNKKPIWKRVWVWILAGIILFAVIGGMGGNSDTDNSDASINTPGIADTKPTTNEIDGLVCEIVSAEIGGKNYEGKSTVVITYNYTNNSNDAQSFDIGFIDTVFQNGIECSPDYLYDEENSTKEIRPGATIEVKKSYILNDTTTDVEVEIKGFITWDETVITKTFSIQ